jgi:hypothetical protein
VTFGPKRHEVTGGWRKLHNEELHNFYSSPSIIRMIKSRRMRWAGHVGRMGEKSIAYRILVGMPDIMFAYSLKTVLYVLGVKGLKDYHFMVTVSCLFYCIHCLINSSVSSSRCTLLTHSHTELSPS